MKILVVSDHEEKRLYEHFDHERWVGKVDMAISCGDLHPDYLSYLVTVLRVPLLYVHGNHDTRYTTTPPDGCDRIDGRLVHVSGLRVAGIGGSPQYNAGSEEFQYSGRQMRWRARRLSATIWQAGGAEIIVSHAAPIRCSVQLRVPHEPAGTGRPCIRPDLEGHPEFCPEATDTTHRSTAAFNGLIGRWKPRYWFHGHNHIEYGRVSRLWWLGRTQVINADGHVVIDTEQPIDPDRGSMVAGVFPI